MKKLILLFCFYIAASQIFAQNMISGNVIRENKKPIEGVKITIEGVEGLETYTDKLGNFDLEVPLTAKVMIFSFEGMKTQKIGIGKKSFINVTMIAGVDEPVKPEPKKDEKSKDTAKVKTKGTPATTSDSKKSKDTKESKSKDDNKDKSKDNNKDKSKDNTKDKSKTKATESEKQTGSDSTVVKEPVVPKSEKSKSDSKKDKKSK